MQWSSVFDCYNDLLLWSYPEWGAEGLYVSLKFTLVMQEHQGSALRKATEYQVVQPLCLRSSVVLVVCRCFSGSMSDESIKWVFRNSQGRFNWAVLYSDFKGNVWSPIWPRCKVHDIRQSADLALSPMWLVCQHRRREFTSFRLQSVFHIRQVREHRSASSPSWTCPAWSSMRMNSGFLRRNQM